MALAPLAGCGSPEAGVDEGKLEVAVEETLLRGEVDLAKAAFRPCEGGDSSVLVDSTGGALRRAVDVLGGPEQPVYVEALGRRSGAVTLVSLRRVVPLGEGGGCKTPPEDARVVARGNEPFWSVRVLGDRIVFSEPDAPNGIQVPADPPVTREGRLVYRSAAGGLGAPAIELVLENRGCTDSMSGEYMHLTARVRVDGRTMSGCAHAAAEDLPTEWGTDPEPGGP